METNRDEQREEWEGEFDKRFDGLWMLISTEYGVPGLGNKPKQGIFDFISTLLQKERQKAESEKKALVEEILAIPWNKPQDEAYKGFRYAGQCIKAIAQAHNINLNDDKV